MWLRSVLCLVLALLFVACEPKLPSPFKASDVTAKYAGADFHLYDTDGRSVSLADYRGKVVVLFFGYTHCPQICPTTLADLAQAMRSLGEQAGQVQVLFVTLDPARDTPSLLAAYVPAFFPSFKGLSGDNMATAQAAKAFGVSWTVQPNASGYDLDHTAGTYLIGPAGRPVLLAPYAQRTEWLVHDIKLLLAIR